MDSPPDIQQLSPGVINKIAAGEVIERPASVVKELMENSIDARSTRVDVTIEAGGVDLIRITDNGHGVRPEQLPLALATHATSKIRSAEDLFHVRTMGFRGEALASIASVSRFLIRSRTAASEAGAEIELIGGNPASDNIEPTPCGAPPGTTVEVRNLFFNTPVRRKFLKTTQTEAGHVSEAFLRIALGNPHVHCTLRHNQKQLQEAPPTEDWLERIATFFGTDLADELIWVESQEACGRLYGYVAPPHHNRSTQRMQYLFVNGRYIRDRALGHALGEAYKGLLMTGRYPVCFLCLEMPAEKLDVNVHPTKLEARFQDAGQLYSQLLGTLRVTFLNSDLTARWSAQGSSTATAAANSSGQTGNVPSGASAGNADAVRRDFVAWAKGELDHQAANLGSPGAAPPPQQQGIRFGQEEPRPLPPRLAPWEPAPSGTFAAPQQFRRTDPGTTTQPGTIAGPDSFYHPVESNSPHPARTRALQVHDQYLICETPEGVIVIDQHALHERILYEQFRERVLAGRVESQQLLVPEPVDLSGSEAAAILDHQELLGSLGIRVEPFGGETVLISKWPAMLKGTPSEVLRDLAARIDNGGKLPDRRELIDELLHMMACKAAIKAGDPLTPQEIDALLQQRHLAQDSHHCPHGRPTSLVFTREELDRQFKRI